jgi:2-polyprenyl-3-methyl-5-hydroxy-6-metoxy-1,4-benzoquinol methylase
MTHRLLAAFERYPPDRSERGIDITEIGGGNSCFVEPILKRFRAVSYRVIDTDARGLSLLRERAGLGPVIDLKLASVLDLSGEPRSDMVFSVGMIEHFPVEEMKQAIRKHIELLRPGGTLLVTFHSSTWLYRLARAAFGYFGARKLNGKRPLERSEVLSAVGRAALLLYEETMWPLIFTQHLMVFRRSTGRESQRR